MCYETFLSTPHHLFPSFSFFLIFCGKAECYRAHKVKDNHPLVSNKTMDTKDVWSLMVINMQLYLIPCLDSPSQAATKPFSQSTLLCETARELCFDTWSLECCRMSLGCLFVIILTCTHTDIKGLLSVSAAC